MTYAPPTLTQLRAYLSIQTDTPMSAFGIVGNAAHTGGYHLGADRLRATDYSRQTARDKAGLSNAASAIDIPRFDGYLRMATWLIDKCVKNDPLTRDIREVILEANDGRHVRRWDDVRGTLLGTSPLTDTHHVHVSYYRDSESRAKTPLFAAYFLPDTATEDIVYSIKGVPGPFPCTVKAGTAFYSSPEDQTPNGTLDDPSRPFTCVGETKDGQRRYIYGRTQVDAERSALALVPSTGIVR